MKKRLGLLLLAGICFSAILLQSITMVYAGGETKTVERITYYSTEPSQRGLWVFDPATRQGTLLEEGIGDNYQFSPDGRYLAFVVNNLDRGKSQSNTTSLWVRDISDGTECALIADFDTDANLDSTYQWLPTGELAVTQVSSFGERGLKVYRPTGELIWQVPDKLKFLQQRNGHVLLQNISDGTLFLFNLDGQRLEPIRAQGYMAAEDVSPSGKMFVYRTYKEIILYNPAKDQRIFVSGNQYDDVEFAWSPGEHYLLYQVRQKTASGDLYHLTVYNIAKRTDAYSISSQRKILFSWSSDEKQLAMSVYHRDWGVSVWLPEEFSTLAVINGLKNGPAPVYKNGTHEFIYNDYLGQNPALYSYDVDRGLINILHIGKGTLVWQKPALVTACSIKEPRTKVSNLYLAGTSAAERIHFLRPLQLPAGGNGGETAQIDYSTILKWAPGHRTLLYKEDEKTLALIDQDGKLQRIYSGGQTSEPFWSNDGSYVASVIQNEKRDFLLYNVFKAQAFSYPLENDKFQPVQWTANRCWFYDGRLVNFSPLTNSWETVADWKMGWWNKPRMVGAHYGSEILLEIGANLWQMNSDGRFKVITRLNEPGTMGFDTQSYNSPRWSPDDQRILYERRLTQQENGKTGEKTEIWMMDKSGQNHRYLTDGNCPEWVDDQRLTFIKDGHIHFANLVTGQIIKLDTPDVTELACWPSYDGALFAVVAKDKNEKVGLYFYEVKY